MTITYTDPEQVLGLIKKQLPTPRQPQYGYKIPTKWLLNYMNRKRRIYAMTYGNSSSLYIMVNKEYAFLDLKTQDRLLELEEFGNRLRNQEQTRIDAINEVAALL